MPVGIPGKNGMKKWSGGATAGAHTSMGAKTRTQKFPAIIKNINPAIAGFLIYILVDHSVVSEILLNLANVVGNFFASE